MSHCLCLQENLIVGLEPERHDVAIETTHTLERLTADNKKRHDSRDSRSGNKRDEKPCEIVRDDDNRTPEEGICLEFEEFNPEVSEKEKRNQRLAVAADLKKKEFRHNNFQSANNKEINLSDSQSAGEFKKPEKILDVIPCQFEPAAENSQAIYSKPDKSKKKVANKIDITKTNQIKGLNNNKAKESSPKKQQQQSRQSFSNGKPSNSHLDNDVRFEPSIIEKTASLADKIGLFESNHQVAAENRANEIKNIRNRVNHNKKCEIPQETSQNNVKKIAKTPTKSSAKTLTKTISNGGTQMTQQSTNKNARERDRGVEVYMETVRQRSTVTENKKQLSANLFHRQPIMTSEPTHIEDEAYDEIDQDDGEDEAAVVGLPSVRKLLARFENGDSVTDHSGGGQARKLPSSKPFPSPQQQQQPVIKSVAAPGSKSFQPRDSVTKYKPGVPQAFRPAVEERVEREAPQFQHSYNDDEDEDDVIEANFEPTKHWDPQYFVRSLYKIPDIGESEDDGFISLDSSQSCPSIEGYMERLPAGRKKSTMWNSWKKQYFVARSGVLFVYDNKSQEEVVDKFELFGGQVDFMDSAMLGLQDRRGQYLVVKCSSHRAAQEWESALSFHTMEDYSNTFTCPAPIPRNIRMLSNVIVIDLGGASVRAGIAGPQQYLPRVFFPSLMAVHPGNVHEKYFGFDALKPEIRATCNLSQPLLPSRKVDKYSVDLVALCGLLLRVFKDLQVDPKKFELQLSVPRNFNDKTKAAIASLLFDEFEVQAVNMGHQTVFALHSYRTDTGVVVDIGERMDVVPIVSGYKVQSGISRTATGGGELVTHMKHALLGRNYSLTSDLDSYVVRHVIEKLCYIPKSYDLEMDKLRQDAKFADKSVMIEEESSSRITIGVDRFETTEGLFKPELWGLDQAGIHVLVKKAIAECSLDARKEVTRSIFLSGGTTMVPGFNHRLESELEKLLPARPKVHASPYRYHAAFLGASYHATSEEFNRMKLKRKDWVSGQAKNAASLWVL